MRHTQGTKRRGWVIFLKHVGGHTINARLVSFLRSVLQVGKVPFLYSTREIPTAINARPVMQVHVQGDANVLRAFSWMSSFTMRAWWSAALICFSVPVRMEASIG